MGIVFVTAISESNSVSQDAAKPVKYKWCECGTNYIIEQLIAIPM